MIAVAVGFAAWIFGGYHRFAFSRELKRALQAGAIPAQMLKPRMGVLWLFRNATYIPNGEYRRVRIGVAIVIWVIVAALLTSIMLMFGPVKPA